jgi:hypothetical protein
MELEPKQNITAVAVAVRAGNEADVGVVLEEVDEAARSTATTSVAAEATPPRPWSHRTGCRRARAARGDVDQELEEEMEESWMASRARIPIDEEPADKP